MLCSVGSGEESGGGLFSVVVVCGIDGSGAEFWVRVWRVSVRDFLGDG